uniref:Transmembrane and immunoglobulin domain containing 1 n=1 Tax=Stegastes partitus TaxID=144197 RepID=A0A3B5AYB9_9TELE
FSGYLVVLQLSVGVNVSVLAANSEGLIEVELETTVSLSCGVDDAEKELVWLRNGVTVTLKEENKKGRSSVCVSPVIHDDNDATFTCHIKENSTFEASVTLNVTYPPELSGSEEVTVEEEAELVLRCDIWANPPVSSVVWVQNGSLVDLLAGGFIVNTDGHASELRATKVERSLHVGTYQCTAHSSKYGAFTKTFPVTVTDKTIKFPLMPMIAGIVVVFLTALLAFVSRWRTIVKVTHKTCT